MHRNCSMFASTSSPWHCFFSVRHSSSSSAGSWRDVEAAGVRVGDDPVNLEVCLPESLRGTSTTLTRMAAGMSGAQVYRVDHGKGVSVLKVTADDEPLDAWRRKVDVLRSAGAAGVAPRVVHTDESRRAVVTEFVEDRSFPQFYRDPRTHAAALALLGTTIKRIHALAVPEGAQSRSARAFLADLWPAIATGYPLPPFVDVAVREILAEEPSAPDAAPVLSHNDMNPSNLIFDGERLLILDWDTMGPNDRWYDLAVASLFLRMDDAERRQLLTAYAGDPATGTADAVPAGFRYYRRLAGVLAGVMMLTLARQARHPGATIPATLGDAPSLADVYRRMQPGALSLSSGEGRWAFGLALMREALER